MRIAIIILGVIALVFLTLKWDTFSPDSKVIPKEGPVLNSNNKLSASPEGKTAICPKCNNGDKIVLASEKSYFKTCNVHETIAINL